MQSCTSLLSRDLFCFDCVLYSLSYAGSRDLVISQWSALNDQNKQRFLNETFKTRWLINNKILFLYILPFFTFSSCCHPILNSSVIPSFLTLYFAGKFSKHYMKFYDFQTTMLKLFYKRCIYKQFCSIVWITFINENIRDNRIIKAWRCKIN